MSHKPRHVRRWAAWEDQLLRERYCLETDEQLGAQLGRTPVAVHSRAVVLGLHSRRSSTHYSLREVAQHCGISYAAVIRAKDAGLLRTIGERTYHYVTDRELERVRRFLQPAEVPPGYITTDEAARLAGYTANHVAALARLGMVRSVKVKRRTYVFREDVRNGINFEARTPAYAEFCRVMAEKQRARTAAKLRCVSCRVLFSRRKGSGRQRLRCEACRLTHRREATRAH